LNNYLKIFKALSDSNRLRIYKILSVKELCVCEITDILGLAISTISSHLKIMKEAGLIEELKDGKWVNYRLCQPVSDFEKQIAILLVSINDAKFAEDKTAIENTNRNEICKR
jgi:ArsR family transcriptional regulator